MKKLTILLALFITVSAVYAQKSKVVSAYNYKENGQLDKAKNAIDEASKNPSSNTLAKTWLYKGQIYMAIYESKIKDYKSLSDNPLEIAKESLNKCIELDDKGRYKEDARKDLRILAWLYYSSGYTCNQKGEYADAQKHFQEASLLFGEAPEADTSLYYAGICAELDSNYSEAKNIFAALSTKGFDKPLIYKSLSRIYTGEKDEQKAIDIVKKGLEKFPGDLDLIVAEVNVYLAFDKTEEAINSLKLAIEMNPENENLYYVLGAKYSTLREEAEKNKNWEEAEKLYLESEKQYMKTLEMNPKHFDAQYNFGALYNNYAAAIMGEANSLPFGDPKYDTLKAKADELLKKAIPELEKALVLDPNDYSTLVTLRTLYANSGETEKYKEVVEKINELKK